MGSPGPRQVDLGCVKVIEHELGSKPVISASGLALSSLSDRLYAVR